MKVIAGVRGKQRDEAKALHADQVVAIDDDQAIAALDRVDAIADTVGHDVITKLLPHLRDDGVLATVVGKPKGTEGKPFRVAEVWAQPDAARLQQLAQAVAEGKFEIAISKRMKLSEAGEAQRLAEGGGLSKVLLLP